MAWARIALCVGVLAGLGACTTYRLDQSSLGASAPEQDPNAPAWRDGVSQGAQYVQLRSRFVPSNESVGQSLCPSGFWAAVNGGTQSLIVVVRGLQSPTDGNVDIPVLTIAGQDATLSRRGSCATDITAGVLTPLMPIPAQWALPARRRLAATPNPDLASIAARTATLVGFFTSGGNPIVGTLAGFATDQRVRELQEALTNIGATDQTQIFSLWDTGIEVGHLRSGRTISRIPIHIEVSNALGTRRVNAGAIEVQAVLRRSMFPTDEQSAQPSAEGSAVPYFGRPIDLAAQVTIPRRGQIQLWDALDPDGVINVADRVATRIQTLPASANDEAIMPVCRAIRSGTDRLMLSSYDRLAVRASALLEAAPFRSSTADRAARTLRSAAGCFTAQDLRDLERMGIPISVNPPG